MQHYDFVSPAIKTYYHSGGIDSKEGSLFKFKRVFFYMKVYKMSAYPVFSMSTLQCVWYNQIT